MALVDVAVKSACAVDPRAAVETIPRSYNFAADILERNLAAGRGQKPAFIDPRGSWTYGELAERVDRFGNVLRALGIRCEERILLRSSIPSTGPPHSSAPSRPASSPFRSIR